MGISFDCFETLVAIEPPSDPASAVADALEAEGIELPDDWERAYSEPHVSAGALMEVSLLEHVSEALASRGVEAEEGRLERGLQNAFDVPVETREGALEAVAAAASRGPVAICSNCSVPGLVASTIEQSTLELASFDAIVTSVECGWRKPAPAIFQLTASHLGVSADSLVHVGDDLETDAGVEAAGGAFLPVEDDLSSLPERFDEALERLEEERQRRERDGEREAGDRQREAQDEQRAAQDQERAAEE